MKKIKLLFIVSCIALIQLTGCSYYDNLPESGKICGVHGRSYVDHFIYESSNRGVYFSKKELQDTYQLDSNGINFYICSDGSKHPMAMEPRQGNENAIKLKCPRKAYVSSEYVDYNCPNPA